ncbi:RsfS/YbeB/iojap family protein, partial [Buchananella hordeovulneris]|uniref:RsfS/YbeB/iojap family protein n=1 Tax=Buchananella hordeovulneris TaxID=52770 RepID=UPI0026DB4F2B
MVADSAAIAATRAAARAAAEKKAESIIALDVSERIVLTDVFLVASGASERQVRAIVVAVDDEMLNAGLRPARKVGIAEGR